MALTASLALDVKAFEAGLKKAEVELQTFERASKSTNRDLKRLMEDFTGQKVVAEAARMSEAVTRIGGASKLTEGEQRRVNAAVTDAINKYKALGQDAPAHLMKLQAETARTEKATSALSGSVARMAAAFTVAGLAETALRAAASGLADFVKRGGEVAGMRASFNALSGGVDLANVRIGAIRVSTQGLVTDMEAMQASNKAMLLGLGLGADQMGELAKTATILGRAMGQDAAKSLDDLITALGRSSPMILDNLGLSVKVGEANETYARALHKTADALTDAERKQAFMNAAMDAAKDKVATIGGLQLTAADRIAQMWTSTKNLADATASWAVSLGPVNSALTQLNNSMKLWETLLRTGKLSETLREFNRQSGETKPPLPEPPKGWQQMPAVFSAVAMTQAEMDRIGTTLTATVTKQTEAASKFNEELQRFGGGEAIKRANELVRVIAALGGPLKVLPSQLASMATAMEAAAEAATVAGKHDLAKQYAALAKTLSPVVQFQQRYNVTIGEYVTKSRSYVSAVREQITGLTETGKAITIGVIPAISLATNAWGYYKAAVDDSNAANEEFEGPSGLSTMTATLNSVADGFARLGQVAGGDGAGQFAKVVTQMANVVQAIENIDQAFSKSGTTAQKWSSIMGLAMQVGTMIADAWNVNEAEKAARDAGRQLGGTFSEAFGAALDVVAMERFTNKLGFDPDYAAAGIYMLRDAIQELGGITDENLDQMTANFRDVFVMLERGVFTTAEAMHVLDENWADFVEAGTDASGALSDGLREMIALAQRFGVVSKEMTKYLREQAAAAIEGATAVIGYLAKEYDSWQGLRGEVDETQKAIDKLNDTPMAGRGREWQADMDAAQAKLTDLLSALHSAGEATGQELETLGFIALGVYEAAIAAGMTHAQALKAAGPGLVQLADAYKALGLDIEDATVKALILQAKVAQTNPALLAGVAGLATAITAMANNGTLTADTFARMQKAAGDMFTRLQGEFAAAGADMSTNLEPLKAMQEYLRAAARESERLGIPLDANTQMLIDQSKELGIWEGEGSGAAETMQETMGGLRDVMVEVKAAIDDMALALRGLPPKVTTEVETRYTTTGNPDPNNPGPGPGPGPGPTAPPVPDRRGDWMPTVNQRPTLADTNAVITVPVYIDGRQVAEATVPYIPKALARRGV